MRELEGGAECPGFALGGGVIWCAYRSCMRQVSDEWVSGAPSSGLWCALRAVRRRRVLFLSPLAPRAEPLEISVCGERLVAVGSAGGLARCALRAFFHALRAATACLRARLASRLASFTRLRARLSSSFAIRTRCRATSACSLARSSGSGSSAAAAWLFRCGADASAPLPAPDGGAPAGRFLVAVFPMRNRGCVAGGGQCHTTAARLPP